MSVAITGASGQLGRRTAELVLDQVDPSSVVLITRDPESVADLAARGAEVRIGDFKDGESLATAFAGVEKLLLISIDALEGRDELQNRAVDSAVAAGVKQIGYTSVVNPAGNAALVAPSHLNTEGRLKDSGVEWTFLRNNLYADDQLGGLEAAKASGQLVTNYGDGRVSFVTREDCALAAAAFLTTDGHADKSYEITGPSAISAAELAALAGPEVEVVQVSDADLIQGLIEHAGLPEFVAEIVASFGKAVREDHMDEVSGAVEELTGRPAMPLTSLLAPAA